MKKEITDFDLTVHVVFILLGTSCALISFSTILMVGANYFSNIERYSLPKELGVMCAFGAFMVLGIFQTVKSIRAIMKKNP